MKILFMHVLTYLIKGTVASDYIGQVSSILSGATVPLKVRYKIKAPCAFGSFVLFLSSILIE